MSFIISHGGNSEAVRNLGEGSSRPFGNFIIKAFRFLTVIGGIPATVAVLIRTIRGTLLCALAGGIFGGLFGGTMKAIVVEVIRA